MYALQTSAICTFMYAIKYDSPVANNVHTFPVLLHCYSTLLCLFFKLILLVVLMRESNPKGLINKNSFLIVPVLSETAASATMGCEDILWGNSALSLYVL